jgi:hypothetical protein
VPRKPRYFQKQVAQGETDLDPAEWSAKVVFTKLGFKVERVQQDQGRVPDFRVSDDTETYVVEVASRYLPEEFESGTFDLYWDLKIKDWLHEARAQCTAIDPNHESIWVLWGAAEEEDETIAVFQAQRAFNSLFGVCKYREQMPTHREVLAVYAKPPLFNWYKSIDCAVVTAAEGRVGILPNAFSPRLGRLKASSFVCNAEAHGFRVFWPTEHLSAQKVVVPDSIDRSSETAVLDYVRGAAKMPSLVLLGEEMTINRRSTASPKK